MRIFYDALGEMRCGKHENLPFIHFVGLQSTWGVIMVIMSLPLIQDKKSVGNYTILKRRDDEIK